MAKTTKTTKTLNPPPYLYLHPNAIQLPESERLLLIPSLGISGTLSHFANLSRTSHSLDIPFPKFHQPSLYKVLFDAISIGLTHPHSSEWRITKSFLQYFRAITLKLTAISIAAELDIHHQSWRRWEGPSNRIPTLLWLNYLWRWWGANLTNNTHNGNPPIRWAEITTPSERSDLRRFKDPKYWQKQELIRLTKLMNDR